MGINTGLAIISALLLVAGIGCLWWRRSSGREAALMSSLQTTKVGALASTSPGTLVEIKGTVRCSEPLTSDFAQRQCVYFRSEITREDVYYDTDAQGKQRRNTRKSTVHSNIQHAPCRVEDETGSVAVLLEGAEVEGVKVVDGYGIPGSLANTISAIANVVSDTTFKHWERVLPTDTPVYLLGEIQTDGSIGKPGTGSGNKNFIISYKSEEERTKDLESDRSVATWLALICFGLAIAVLVWAFVRGPA